MALAPLSQTIFLTEDGSAVRDPKPVTIPPLLAVPSVTLGTLTLSARLMAGAASIGTIIGATAGSTVLSGIAGLTVDSAARTYAWTGGSAVGGYPNGLTETHPNATNSGRASPLTVEDAPIVPVPLPDPAAIDWSTAAMIGHQTGTIGSSSPAAVMRRTFTPAKTVARATLQATALGTYIAYLNGARVGDREMTPGWTDYTKRRHFQTYDVTSMIGTGVNALGVEVGDGWAHGYMSLRGRNYYGADVPRAMVALRLDYADGTSETIVSDASWKATTSDNLVNDWYNGSSHDLRLRKDWSNPATSDAGWASPTVVQPGAVPLVKQPSPAARRMETIAPIGRTNPRAGVYIFDFGLNHAGFCSLTVKGAAAGQQIMLRHAEDLKDDGTLYTANLRAAQATDRFISAGGGTETFEPRHTWHGYRYVEITGYPGVPPLDCLTSNFVYQDAPLASTFATSSPVLQNSWDAAVLAWKSNALTLPTDCPQRDERLGWGADAHLFAQAATFVQDTGAFLDKYCDDLDDSAIDGLVGDVAPHVTDVARGRAGWGEAAIIIPWTLYQAYGDTGYLSRHWTTMKAVLGALPYVDFYNDYLHLGQPTSPDVFRYAYAYHAADIIKRSADLLGDAATSATAASKMASFSASWNAFVSGGGSVIGNEAQCGYILGLAFGILPAGQRAAAVSALASKIMADGLKCGFVGLTYLHDVLADGGRLDLAYALAEKTTAPSLGHQLGTGLTTTGEQWDPRGLRGVNDAANSYNHYVRGAILSWIARSVAGIDAASPGFATVLLRPRPGGAATSARLTYASKAGTIATDWSIAGNKLIWSFTTPVQAIVSLPPGFVTTGLTGAIAPDPITGGERYQVAAGSYSITATLTSTYVAAGYVADGYIGAL